MPKLSEFAKELGKRGGKKSVEKRFKNKTKKQISEMMQKVRLARNSQKKDAT